MARHAAILILFYAIASGSLCQPCIAQRPRAAMEAYDYVQQKRDQAEKLWAKEGAQEDDVEKGIQILTGTLVYLDDPIVMELARGNPYLRSRRSNVFFDLALANGILGRKAETVHYLRSMMAEGVDSSVADLLCKTPALKSVRQEPGYQEILEQLDAKKKLWDGAALKTAYKENLSEDEKVAGLSLFWSEAKYNFANFDLVPDLDWNQLYLTYLPEVRATKNTSEYYRVLQKLCARLRDGHTNVYPPKELEDAFYPRPPLRSALVEGKVLITEVRSEQLLRDGIRTGLEILSVDGVPVREYAEQRVIPYQSSSTKQDLEVRAYTYALFAGPKDQPIELELQNEGGMAIKKRVARTGYADVKIPSTFEFKMLDGNVAYVELNSFDDNDIVKSFDSVFDQIVGSAALILDVRANGGGSSNVGYKILAYLTDKPFKISRWKTLDYRASYRAWGLEPSWDGEPIEEFKPNGKRLYKKPVVVLTSARTFSAAEDFVVAFDYMKRGQLIGEPTGGSTGQPLLFDLPGGGSARVCTKRDSYPDGKEFVGVGIMPDILVRPTIAGVRAGEDEALKAAIDHLRQSVY